MLKRFFDLIFSLLLILLLSPLLLIISFLIITDCKGGLLYKQKRVGLENHDFNIFKFRTMHPGSDKHGLLTVGAKDKRITRIGYFLRKYKLDELPQLFNVLKGDMSMVGPRPEVRKYVNLYSPEQLKVLNVKPGITDYASIQYAAENEILALANDPEKEYIHTVMPAKLKLNLDYIREKNFLTDLKILSKTFKRIFLNFKT
jgi:lipopolysaccharide/colanic/teichoic acid biosynthesis glycosyltransferase